MPCFHPIKLPADLTRVGSSHTVPCGRCTGCRLEKSRQWAIRLMHEAQLHERTSFLTLTYKNECLPTQHRATSSKTHRRAAAALARQKHPVETAHGRQTPAHEIQEAHGSLVRRHLQLFTKRLNEDVRRRLGNGVRYYACGEYGDQTHRPHYHIALFGEDFSDDRQKWKRSNGHQLWRSSRLTSLWGKGDVDIGELTFESAAYVARYIMKKVTGPLAAEHYRRTDAAGNDYWIEPEFAVMSRGGRGGKGGLGKGWFDQYQDSVYPHDRVILTRGDKRVPTKPPRYYDALLERADPARLEAVKQARDTFRVEVHPRRLRAGEAILRAKLKQSKRPLE